MLSKLLVMAVMFGIVAGCGGGGGGDNDPPPVASRFADNGDGTVSDSRLGVMWQQSAGGYGTYTQASEYCSGLTIAGLDWRIPPHSYLETLIDGSRIPAIDPLFMSGEAFYWTSTPDTTFADMGFPIREHKTINFKTGLSGFATDTNALLVRCYAEAEE